MFDQFGEEGLKGGAGGMPGGFQAGDPSKIFEQFFGGQDPFAAFFGGGEPVRRRPEFSGGLGRI